MNALSCADILAGRAPQAVPVTVQGWVRTRRDSKAGISFVHLSDGSGFHPVQVVAPNTLPNYASEISRLTAGCAVEATGMIVPSPAKGQPFEMQASALKVVGWVDDPDSYPIQPKPHTLEFLREVAHLRPRTNVIGAVSRVRHTIALAVHGFFDQNGFVWINTPIITTSDAEGAGELFRVSTLDLANLPRTAQGGVDFGADFFGREAFLTVSGQLNIETYCMALSKVYTFGPTFRAENSNTSRHLAEFWMIEPEIAFADLSDNATLAEALLKHVFRTVLEERADDMAFFEERIEKGVIAKLQGMIDAEFVRMDYGDAISILEKATQKFEFPVRWGMDLQSEHERYVSESYVRGPVFWSTTKEIKAFYMRLNDGGRQSPRWTSWHPASEKSSAAASAGTARCPRADGRGRHGHGAPPVSRPAPLRHRAACRIQAGLRAHDRLRDGLANVRDVIPFPRSPGNAY
jgi:asparaginyl-tRNA synthetase